MEHSVQKYRAEYDIIAAEYVMGLLCPVERGGFERELQVNATLRVMVADWERRLICLGPTAVSNPSVPDLSGTVLQAIEKLEKKSGVHFEGKHVANFVAAAFVFILFLTAFRSGSWAF